MTRLRPVKCSRCRFDGHVSVTAYRGRRDPSPSGRSAITWPRAKCPVCTAEHKAKDLQRMQKAEDRKARACAIKAYQLGVRAQKLLRRAEKLRG